MVYVITIISSDKLTPSCALQQHKRVSQRQGARLWQAFFDFTFWTSLSNRSEEGLAGQEVGSSARSHEQFQATYASVAVIHGTAADEKPSQFADCRASGQAMLSRYGENELFQGVLAKWQVVSSSDRDKNGWTVSHRHFGRATPTRRDQEKINLASVSVRFQAPGVQMHRRRWDSRPQATTR